MRILNILSGLMVGFGLLLSSCTDDLDQMPVTETTSQDVYSNPENYKKFSPRFMRLMFSLDKVKEVTMAT